MGVTSEPKYFFEHFSSMLTKRYSNEVHLSSFLSELELAFHWMTSNCDCEFLTTAGGCVVLFVERQSSSMKFGFFVIPAKQTEADELWASLISKAKSKGIQKLSGPIQGNTFFPYRFISKTDGSPFFKGEYFSDGRDHEFMMSQFPASVNEYVTGRRDYFDGIMEVSKPYFDKAVDQGLEIRKYSEVDVPLFKEVFELVGKIFGDNWSFSHLTEAELMAVYQNEFGAKSKLVLHTYHLEGKMIGFCRFIEENDETLICKTLGVLPEYQKLGLGNAAVYEFHKDAKELGYSKMYYALIFVKNRVKQNMPKDDAEFFRHYASYEFEW